ncbi:MAG: AAA family ATPase [Burkholderiaceae bacterium]|nr:AAA family ATPase [Burkholderiaceae bacterium]
MLRVGITGGPGVGKTTLLAELAARGYATVAESARAIISEPFERTHSTHPCSSCRRGRPSTPLMPERDHSFPLVEQVHSQLVQWYRSCGYAVCEVPRLPVAQRAEFVLQVLAHGAA